MQAQQQCQQPITVRNDEPAQTPRRPWHQPCLERLHVSLDTAFGGSRKVSDATQGFDSGIS